MMWLVGACFSLSLGLRRATELGEPDMRARARQLVAEIDNVNQELRRILRLGFESESVESLEDELRKCLLESANALGFEPRFTVTGTLDEVFGRDPQGSCSHTSRSSVERNTPFTSD